MVSLDTNILVYAANIDAGDRYQAAKGFIATAASASLALTDQSLIEFLNVSIRKKRQPFDETAAIVRGWLASFPLIMPPNTIVADTLELLSKHKLSVWDARLLVTCDAASCEYLFSEDMQDGARYGGVTVIDPFKPRNAAIIEQVMSL